MPGISLTKTEFSDIGPGSDFAIVQKIGNYSAQMFFGPHSLPMFRACDGLGLLQGIYICLKPETEIRVVYAGGSFLSVFRLTKILVRSFHVAFLSFVIKNYSRDLWFEPINFIGTLKTGTSDNEAKKGFHRCGRAFSIRLCPGSHSMPELLFWDFRQIE